MVQLMNKAHNDNYTKSDVDYCNIVLDPLNSLLVVGQERRQNLDTN